MKDKVLCVDGGGSSTQVCICQNDDFSTQLFCMDVGPVSLKSSSATDVEASFKKITDLFFANEDLRTSVKCAVFALSGLDRPSDIEQVVEICKQAGLTERTSSIIESPYGHMVTSAFDFPILLCSDALLPLFAEEYDAGVSIISGTGSVALRINSNGKYERFGGRGYRVSDLGSGYWVGTYLIRNALRAAEAIFAGHMKISGSLNNLYIESAIDLPDRNNVELMHSLICAFMALGYLSEDFNSESDLANIHDNAFKVCEWAANHDDPKDYVSLARVALSHDDIFELGLNEKTARQLSELAMVAIDDPHCPIVASGGIFKNPGIRDYFTKNIHAQYPEAHIVVSSKDLLAGAFNIARKVFKDHISHSFNADDLKPINPSIDTPYDLVEKDGLYILQSKAFKQIPWVINGTTLRLGGASAGFTESLNFCLNEYDFPQNVEENYSRLCKVIGTTPNKLASIKQVHGSKVIKVDEQAISTYMQTAPSNLSRGMWLDDADALITNLEDITLCIYTADCVPISIVDPIHRAIGIAHAGWRGTLKEIASKTLSAMNEAYGTSPQNVIIQIGPSICQNCYEVDDVVADEARKIFDENELKDICIPSSQGKYQFSLWEANRIILTNAGVLPENMYLPQICTCCNSDYLFSHRASDGKRGTVMTFLGIR